jgi:hypothetical protein
VISIHLIFRRECSRNVGEGAVGEKESMEFKVLNV